MKIPPKYTPPHLTFFGDSSSRDSQYMVAGGFAVEGGKIHQIEKSIKEFRDEAGIKSEFHWSKYRGGRKQAAYEKLVDYAFSLIEGREVSLHIIIVPFHDFNHKAKAGENRDTSINKMYYQLGLNTLAPLYGRSHCMHMRLDAGNDSEDICNMRNQLCAAAYRYKNALPNSFRSIQAVDSKHSGIIQMADVIVGGVAAKRNDVKHTSPKGTLADFILDRSGRREWDTNTLKRETQFTVWQFKTK